MLYDVRTYRCRPGSINKHFALYEELGWAAQTRNLGQPALYLFTESGPVNTYMHIWQYEDAAERAAKRATMQADPEWTNYTAKSAEAGYLVQQDNQLMLPAPFFKPGK